MPPFIRVKVIQFELDNAKSNDSNYLVSVNIKECVMEHGKLKKYAVMVIILNQISVILNLA